MPLVSTPAIVLSALRYSETSKIVRLATREFGVQSAIAKGALRPRSRFGAALQLLSEGQAQLLTKDHRELHTLTAFDLTRLHAGLAADLVRYAAASALAEVMLRFAPPDPHPESFDLLLEALGGLETSPAPSVDALGIRLLWHQVGSLGFAPSRRCVRLRREPAAARCRSAFQRQGRRSALPRVRLAARGDAASAAVALRSHESSRPRRGPARAGCPPRRGAQKTARAIHPIPPRRRRRAAGARLLDASAMGGCLIIGTAGHIDHGKSALVTALTGAPMDRLAEEQRRGITIDLNFAPLQLADGTVAGVIDVPGHEDFVRTMVAGASGVDLALLVIAADEGIMPQTLEHLAVLEHLRVPAGIPVLTKSDLASPEQVQRLSSEVARRLSASPVEFERPVAVSVRSGEGLDLLRALIEARAGALAASRSRRPVPATGGSGILGTGRGNGGHRHRLVRLDRRGRDGDHSARADPGQGAFGRESRPRVGAGASPAPARRWESPASIGRRSPGAQCSWPEAIRGR